MNSFTKRIERDDVKEQKQVRTHTPEDLEKINSQWEQKPVAWHEPDSYGNVTTYKEWAIEHGWRPLYTAPPKQDEGSNKEKVSEWMINKGYATGHGTSVVDLLQELEWQVAEREREACAKVVEADGLARGNEGLVLIKAASRIRARGEK